MPGGDNDKKKVRGNIDQANVKRYWPGKAPEWTDYEEEQEEEGDLLQGWNRGKAFPCREDEYGDRENDDARLRRLTKSRVDNKEETRADRRRIRQAEIVSATKADSHKRENLGCKEEEDEDALQEKRRKIREKLLLKEQEEAAALLLEETDDLEEEEEESEYETDLEDDSTAIAMLKPVFVHKLGRDTIAERERLQAEEHVIQEMVKMRMAQRKTETKQIVVAEVEKDEQIQKNLKLETEATIDMDTDDELNEAEEYERWKIREVARIKREKEVKAAAIKEKEEIDKLRNMTAVERKEWETKNPKPLPQPKRKWKFLQRYYHKGAFFQSEDNCSTNDFSSPTGEDKMDKSKLPKVLQVKNFGRSGRTKWTHLLNEDTTNLRSSNTSSVF